MITTKYSELIARLAESQAERNTLTKAIDRIMLGEKKGLPVFTAFLSPREQILAAQVCKEIGLHDICFFGGADFAERKLLVYVPEYLEPVDAIREADPIVALRAEISEYDKLTHRDYLGAILGLGIKREVIGDLYVEPHACSFVALSEMGDFLCNELTTAGRASVHVRRIQLSALQNAKPETKRISETVASLRLDSVVSAGFRISRQKAQSLIHAGLVECDHLVVTKNDYVVQEGAVLSAKGYGKLCLSEISGKTKKDRVSIKIDRYL